MSLGAPSLPVCVDRKEEKEKRGREGGKEINSATKLLIFNQIISNSLGITGSAKLFLTNPARLLRVRAYVAPGRVDEHPWWKLKGCVSWYLQVAF